jgi:hypothetical protein
VTAPGVFTPYSTIAPLLGVLPGWVDTPDQQRVASYGKYEEIYWSSESGFSKVMRGDNEAPVMLATARTLVNTVDKYTAPKFGWRVDPAPLPDGSVPQPTPSATGEPAANPDVRLVELAFEVLFAREAFLSKFASNKLNGLIKGDWLWHVVADPEKPAGKRLSLRTLEPGNVFKVYDIDDPDRVVKIHIAEQVMVDGQPKVSRLTYEKVVSEGANPTTIILRSHGIFKQDKWWESTTPELVVLGQEELPPEITAFPVYHLKNFDPTSEWGSSELRGLESTLAGINQSASDEDLTLAMEGLGVYATDGGPPRDENGNETDVILGPARVISNANGLRRITGTTSVSPYGDHMDRLERSAREAVGASDVAIGRASSGEAEAGIALEIRLSSILAHTAKKDVHILDVHTQLFHDLQFWLAVYEELPLLNGAGPEATPKVVVLPTIGSAMPVNLTEVITQIVNLRNCVPPVISIRTCLNLLRAAGMEVPEDEEGQLATEASNSTDPLGEPGPGQDAADQARLDAEGAAADADTGAAV